MGAALPSCSGNLLRVNRGYDPYLRSDLFKSCGLRENKHNACTVEMKYSIDRGAVYTA